MTWKWKNRRNASLGVHPVQQDQHHERRQKQRISWPEESCVALLIDGDHMPAHSISLFQFYAERLGSRPLQWVYGNWEAGNLAKWQAVVSEYRLEARHCGPVTPGKNAADIALTVDAMLLYGEGVRKFVLVASDSDYTPLVAVLRACDCIVMVIGKTSTPLALQQAASAFRLIDHSVLPEPLVPVYERSHAVLPVVLPQADRVVPSDVVSGEATPLQLGASPEQLHQWVLAQLMVYETAPYAWVEVPRFGHYLGTICSFRSKEHSYKSITVLLKAFPKVFEVRSFQEKVLLDKVRRVKT